MDESMVGWKVQLMDVYLVDLMVAKKATSPVAMKAEKMEVQWAVVMVAT